MRCSYCFNKTSGIVEKVLSVEFTTAPDFKGLDRDTQHPWDPSKVAKLLGFTQMSDQTKIEEVCIKLLLNSPTQVSCYRAGNRKILGWFFKQVLDLTNQGADPKLTIKTLSNMLDHGDIV